MYYACRYATYGNLVNHGAKFGKQSLRVGQSTAVFFSEPAFSALPKAVKHGDTLVGSVTYGSANDKIRGAGKRPGGFPVTYMVPPAPPKDKSDDPTLPDERSELERLEESIRDHTVKKLEAFEGKTGYVRAEQIPVKVQLVWCYFACSVTKNSVRPSSLAHK